MKFLPTIKTYLGKIHPLVLTSFLTCFICWFYLLYVTKSLVVFDSTSFELLGRKIYQEGWISFLKAGPHREIGYALLVSFAMRAADLFHTDYLSTLRVIQFVMLFIAIYSSYYLARRLNIHPIICSLMILYMGLSPGIVNSALILYSEAVCPPFIVLIIVFGFLMFKNIDSLKKCLSYSVLMGLCLLYLTLVKGVFEPLSYLLVILLSINAVFVYRNKDLKRFKHYLLIIAALFLSYYLPLNSFKFANQHFNQEFTLTDRGGRILYASTIPRVENITPKHVSALIAQTAGSDVCIKFFDRKYCDHWEWWSADKKALAQLPDFAEEYSIEQPLNQKDITYIAFRKILSNPLQYIFITFIGAFKIFTWEYFYGFVAYPNWMDNLFLNNIVQKFISYSNGIINFLTFFLFSVWIFRQKKNILHLHTTTDKFRIAILLFTFLFGFIILSSLFWIIKRYVLVIAPLYIIATAFILNELIFNRKTIT